MRFEKDGYTVEVKNKNYTISNKYGVHERGTVLIDSSEEEVCKCVLISFLSRHMVNRSSDMNSLKRVAVNEEGTIIQLRAFNRSGSWFVQEFDAELLYIKSKYAGEVGEVDLPKKIREMYNIQNGLHAYVLKNQELGDCTNHGISEEVSELCIISDKGPFPATDIRRCVTVEKVQTRYGDYVKCKPIYQPNYMYAAGGNFLYTNDCIFKEITGIEYPVPIHDHRVELF